MARECSQPVALVPLAAAIRCLTNTIPGVLILVKTTRGMYLIKYVNNQHYQFVLRFSTYFTMACSSRDYGGYLTDDCRKIGQSYSSKFTYVGYHAVQSGWEERNREDVDLYLPIDESVAFGWKGPCEDTEWEYCPLL